MDEGKAALGAAPEEGGDKGAADSPPTGHHTRGAEEGRRIGTQWVSVAGDEGSFGRRLGAGGGGEEGEGSGGWDDHDDEGEERSRRAEEASALGEWGRALGALGGGRALPGAGFGGAGYRPVGRTLEVEDDDDGDFGGGGGGYVAPPASDVLNRASGRGQ